jgi:predicted RNA-binding Zn-ribbon protein involved in translation (DUF1610 family)
MIHWQNSPLAVKGEEVKCFSCGTEMVESDEFCWHIGEPIIKETGKLYSKRWTCPKCGHWERSDFINQTTKFKQEYNLLLPFERRRPR